MNTSPSPTAIAWAARVDRLEPGAAQPVDGLTADLDREVRQQQRHPGDVAVVLAGLVRAAEDDVLDERRVDPGPLDDGTQDRRGEVVRADARQRAAVASDRGADRLDDPGLTKRAMQVSGHGSIVGARRPRAMAARSSADREVAHGVSRAESQGEVDDLRGERRLPRVASRRLRRRSRRGSRARICGCGQGRARVGDRGETRPRRCARRRRSRRSPGPVLRPR